MARIVGIYISPVRKDKMLAVEEARAVPGVGLLGDRYARGDGTFSKKANPSNELTLIESEAIEAFVREQGVEFGLGDGRRNVVTSGVRLNDLVGLEFCLGEVRLRGLRLCPPCGHLAGLTVAEVMPGLKDRGGLRAQILSEGTIRVGDSIHGLLPGQVEANETLAEC